LAKGGRQNRDVISSRCTTQSNEEKIMNSRLLILSVGFAAAAVPALANGPLAPEASHVDAIVQGHGKPGETAVAKSNSNVTFRVLDNGIVERTNKRFGTVSVTDPRAELHKSRDNR
jgi:hypothetical protein